MKVMQRPWLEENHGDLVYSTDFLLKLFHASRVFLYPLETSGFLMLPGVIERDQWHKTG